MNISHTPSETEIKNAVPVGKVAATAKPFREKGLGFARFAMALAQGKGSNVQAYEIAKSRYGERSDEALTLKAAIAAGSTTDPAWAKPLVSYNNLASEFISWLNPQSIVGKFGRNGVPALTQVDFNLSVPRQTSNGSASWIREGAAAPVTALSFDTVTLDHHHIGAISVITEQLARFSSPSAERIVRDGLGAAVLERLDVDFILPSKAAVEGVSPASITNGTTSLASSGSDEDAIRRDVRTMVNRFLAVNVTPENAVWIMPTQLAFALSMLKTPLGVTVYPDLTLAGGTFHGLPVITSAHCPAGLVILVDSSQIMIADDGETFVDASDQASIQMDNAPTNSSVNPTPSQLVSMFQTSSIALKISRYVTWEKKRPSAACYMQGVDWAADAIAS